MLEQFKCDWPDWPAQHLDGVPHIKGLHKAIQVEINGQGVNLLTVGYVAQALRRTTWTIRHWERLNLFPRAPYFLHADVARTRRRLYPEPFVSRLGDIAADGYLGQRIEWDNWKRFYYDVLDAWGDTVSPLLRSGVIGSTPTSILVRVAGVQATSATPRIS
jgi:hypothetical protein